MNKSAVVLVNPKSWSRRSMRLPLSLWSLAAVLAGRYDYAVVDSNTEDDPVAAVLNTIKQFDGRCALVGITVMPGPQIAPAIQISAAVRPGFRRCAIETWVRVGPFKNRFVIPSTSPPGSPFENHKL